MELHSLYLYPIKGFRGIKVPSLRIGNNTLIDDRKYAFLFLDSLKTSVSDFFKAQWLDKGKLVNQNDWPSLAQIEIESNQELSVFRFRFDPKKEEQFDFRTESERVACAKRIYDYLQKSTPSKAARHPKVTELALVGDVFQTRFPDRGKYCLSILNLASLRDLEAKMKKPLGIERFRGNVIIDTGEPWSELSLQGKTLQVGDAKLKVQKPIGRCHNINVDPLTGQDSLGVLEALAQYRGKVFFGVMADSDSETHLLAGDNLSVLD